VLLKKNLIANYLGQGWTALMGLAFIPLYIKYLGIEAYGLIGLYAVLQAWLSLLDMGMTPTLSREMGRFTGGSHSAQSIRDLLRTIEFIAFGVALLIAGGVALGSGWIASSWLQAESLPADVVEQAFMIMGLVTALRFLEGVYRSSIVGLQRQVLLNVVNSVLATVRGLGAVGILVWVSPTIEAFFWWQGVVSIITLAILVGGTYSNLPKTEQMVCFSMKALRSVWRFAGGTFGITFLALLLTQVDKILLSHLLSLTEYSYYALATALSGTLFMLVSPITQAVYPRLCELHAHGNRDGFIDMFHKGSQLISVFAGSFAVLLIVFSDRILLAWTQDVVLSDRVAPLLSLLMFGNLFSGLHYMPYQAQLAHGRTALVFRVHLVSVAVFLPMLFLIVPSYGALGAATVWALFAFTYVLIGDAVMFKGLLSGRKWHWYLNDLLKPLAISLLAAFIIRFLMPLSGVQSENVLIIAVAFLFILGATILLVSNVRKQVFKIVRSFLRL